MPRGSRTNGRARDERTPGPGHNQMNKDERAKIIRNVCAFVSKKKKERDEISAEIRTEVNTKIKGLLDMKIADFNAALRMYDLEDDDRDLMMDTIRETFEALGVQGQLDWVDIAKRADKVRSSDEASADPMH